ncbi:hypothetical protein ZIOFF_038206 [Zingiber officinale]|uniref:Uncharacterized protein n=1 Tax=Zingiber officinale TaxID=94328 RepID=A0A8J5LAJ6_ZINOF|nr:hypothetical protein ZIOFF_038206 [Zingiber officinale]
MQYHLVMALRKYLLQPIPESSLETHTNLLISALQFPADFLQFKAWAKTYPDNKHVKFLADGFAIYTHALGLELDLADKATELEAQVNLLSASHSVIQESSVLLTVQETLALRAILLGLFNLFRGFELLLISSID